MIAHQQIGFGARQPQIENAKQERVWVDFFIVFSHILLTPANLPHHIIAGVDLDLNCIEIDSLSMQGNGCQQ